MLGRKGADLIVQNKRISREHVTFDISGFPTSRVVSQSHYLFSSVFLTLVQDDPTFKPNARLQNPRNKPITVQRGTNIITLDSSSSTELWDGDTIQLVGGITVVLVTKER